MVSEAAPQLRHLLKPILHWLDDPATEEIAINKPGEVFVRQKGIFVRHDLPFDYDDLEDIAILAGALRRQDVGPRSPLCATELPGGERLQICLPPSVPAGTASLTIRRPGTSVSALGDVGKRYHTARWNRWEDRRETANQQNAEALAFYDAGDIEAMLHPEASPFACPGPEGSGIIGGYDPEFLRNPIPHPVSAPPALEPPAGWTGNGALWNQAADLAAQLGYA